MNSLTSPTLKQGEIDKLLQTIGQDQDLQALQHVISNCSVTLMNCWNYRNELLLENGILLKNHKLLILKYLKKIHSEHQGINSEDLSRGDALCRD